MPNIFENTVNRVRQAVDSFANSTVGDWDKKEDKKVEPTEDALWYAEKDGNYFSPLIENGLTRKCLKAIADKYYAEQVEEILDDSVELTKDSYPFANGILEHCIKTLKMSSTPSVYVTNRLFGINALSVETKGRQIILISRKAVMLLGEKELAFLLGHELSHHQQDNLICHTVNGLMNNMVKDSEILGPILMDTIEVPLKRWCRQSEFNADRAGYLCCRDIDAIKKLFVMLGMKDCLDIYHQYKETGEDHPMLETRFECLLEYITNRNDR